MRVTQFKLVRYRGSRFPFFFFRIIKIYLPTIVQLSLIRYIRSKKVYARSIYTIYTYFMVCNPLLVSPYPSH